MVLIIVLAIVSGMALSAQAAINGQLGARVGVVQSALLTFTMGTVVTALLIFFFERPIRRPCSVCRSGSWPVPCSALSTWW